MISRSARDLSHNTKRRHLHARHDDALPPPDMPPPLRIAQTTSEVKKLHKQNGPRLAERQMRQLERGHELDVRAARMREAEERKKAAKKKREEKEEKERAARRQMGVGLATQLIGYSHTQAQLKNGMEAFLGLKRRKEEEQRRRQAELTKTLEAIAQEVEKEPWGDDDEDDENAEGIAHDLPRCDTTNATSPEQYADDDLDDDTLLEAHDLLMSDPPEESTTAAPSPQRFQEKPPQPVITPALPEPAAARDDADFVRLHGPTNKTVESILDKLPDPLVELLSQDISLRLPEWDPTPGLLHKLNPVGLPPHRLRLKVGSIVTLLRDLNTSSQLSKSQHLRVLRADNDRLECLVLDGQLEGTKALLTRVPFPAKYRNDTRYPFQRTQFPIRIATDYTATSQRRDAPSSGFKLPTVPAHVRSSSLSKKSTPAALPAIPKANNEPKFRLPGLPASKKPVPPPTFQALSSVTTPFMNDGWDDFLDSGTQIARELSAEIPTAQPQSPSRAALSRSSITQTLPPLSTQDLDFSIDDLDDSPVSADNCLGDITVAKDTHFKTDASVGVSKADVLASPLSKGGSTPAAKPSRQIVPGKRPPLSPKTLRRQQQPPRACLNIDLAALTASQRPASVSDRPGLKRKAPPFPPRGHSAVAKRSCAAVARPVVASSTRVEQVPAAAFDDFGMSTQDAASFFADDEELFTGSPPIAV